MRRKKRRRRKDVIRWKGSVDDRKKEIEQYIGMLDRVLGQEGGLRSEFEDQWIEGCREGLAIAYDLLARSIQDVAIRSIFERKPIRLRYYEGRETTVSDDSLILAGRLPQDY